jgi:antitoxin (DNA-binding transcriptional repressor) of toxin-antitoxin stability system
VIKVSAADFKTRFSDLLQHVRRGETIAVQYGRRKETVALLVPPPRAHGGAKRPLGILAGKARFRVKSDFKISEEDMLGDS